MGRKSRAKREHRRVQGNPPWMTFFLPHGEDWDDPRAVTVITIENYPPPLYARIARRAAVENRPVMSEVLRTLADDLDEKLAKEARKGISVPF